MSSDTLVIFRIIGAEIESKENIAKPISLNQILRKIKLK
jgi:hypothetical protein